MQIRWMLQKTRSTHSRRILSGCSIWWAFTAGLRPDSVEGMNRYHISDVCNNIRLETKRTLLLFPIHENLLRSHYRWIHNRAHLRPVFIFFACDDALLDWHDSLECAENKSRRHLEEIHLSRNQSELCPSNSGHIGTNRRWNSSIQEHPYRLHVAFHSTWQAYLSWVSIFYQIYSTRVPDIFELSPKRITAYERYTILTTQKGKNNART